MELSLMEVTKQHSGLLSWHSNIFYIFRIITKSVNTFNHPNNEVSRNKKSSYFLEFSVIRIFCEIFLNSININTSGNSVN